MKCLRSPLMLVLLALAACQQQTSTPPETGTSAGASVILPSQTAGGGPTAPPTTPPAAPSGTPVESLAGAWRIAGIDGKSFDEPYGLALTADETAIWWEPRCAGMARRYEITGRSVSFTTTEPPAAAGPPRPVCAIGLPPRLDEVFRALDAANTMVRTPANGIEISGGGYSITLFSQ